MVKFITALSASLDPEKRRELISRISALSGRVRPMPNMDTFIPSGASLDQTISFANGVLIRALASSIEGATSSDIDRISGSIASGEPALYPLGDAVPSGAMGPMELLTLAGIYDPDNEDVNEGAVPYTFGDVSFGDFDETDASEFLQTGDVSVLSGGLGDLFKRRAKRKEEKKVANKDKSPGAKTVTRNKTVEKITVIAKAQDDKQPLVIAPSSGSTPKQVVVSTTTSDGKTPPNLTTMDPTGTVGTILTSGSAAVMKKNVEILRAMVEEQMKDMRDTADALSTAKRQYARLAVASEVLSSPDPVADALLLFPLSFSSVEKLEDAMLPYVQHGSTTSMQHWFQSLKAGLMGAMNKAPKVESLLPLSDAERKLATLGDPITSSDTDWIDDTSPLVQTFLDEDALNTLIDGDPESSEIFQNAEDVYDFIEDNAQFIPPRLSEDGSPRLPIGDVDIEEIALAGDLFDGIQNSIVGGVSGAGEFFKDTWNKVDPRTRQWLGPVAATVAGGLVLSKFMPKTMFFGGGGGGSSAALGGLMGAVPGMQTGLSSEVQLPSGVPGPYPTSGSSSMSIPLNELDPSSTPGMPDMSVPADWPLRMMQLGEQFQERQMYAPWAVFSPGSLTGDVDLEVPVTAPFFLRSDGTFTGDPTPYLPSLVMTGGKFWDVVKKVGKAVGNIATSPIGKAVLGILPGGGAVSAGLDVAKNLLAKTGIDPQQAFAALGSTPTTVAPSGPAFPQPQTVINQVAPIAPPQISAANPDLTVQMMKAAYTPMGAMAQSIAGATVAAMRKQQIAQRRATANAPTEADSILFADPDTSWKRGIYRTNRVGFGPADEYLFSDPEFTAASAFFDDHSITERNLPLGVGWLGLAIKGIPLLANLGKWISTKIGGKAGTTAMGSILTKVKDFAVNKVGSKLKNIWKSLGNYMAEKGLVQSIIKQAGGLLGITAALNLYGKWSKKKKNKKAILETLGEEGKDRFEELKDKQKDGTITEAETAELIGLFARLSAHTDFTEKIPEYSNKGSEASPALDDPEAERMEEYEINDGALMDPASTDPTTATAAVVEGVTDPLSSGTLTATDAPVPGAEDETSIIQKMMPYIIGVGGVGMGAMIMKLLARKKSGVANYVIPVRFTGDPEGEFVWAHLSRVDPFRQLVKVGEDYKGFSSPYLPMTEL